MINDATSKAKPYEKFNLTRDREIFTPPTPFMSNLKVNINEAKVNLTIFFMCCWVGSMDVVVINAFARCVWIGKARYVNGDIRYGINRVVFFELNE